jgi:hypothetical protein
MKAASEPRRLKRSPPVGAPGDEVRPVVPEQFEAVQAAVEAEAGTRQTRGEDLEPAPESTPEAERPEESEELIDRAGLDGGYDEDEVER